MKSPILNALLAAALLGTTATFSAGVAVAAEAEASTAIPGTSAEIWKAIDGNVAELKGLIAKNTLQTVHQHAYAIRDLVRALPSHSPGLSAAALANVSAQVKFVDTLAVRLDASGDANDKAGTEANLAKLENILKTIRAQYGSH
ncbi:MAG: transporter [Proteobacteria bacterium]|nr:transporter [Pseudomonadota bacterium]